MANERTEHDWTNLCESVKQLVPPQIGTHAWEVIIAAALIASPEPQLLGQFYSFLSQHDQSFGSQEEQRRLSLRFRDTIIKLTTLVGAPQAICALIPLAKAEGEPEEKARTSALNSKWSATEFVPLLQSADITRDNVNVPSIHARGTKTIDSIYGPLLPKIFQGWGDHTQDFQFVEIFGVYGLYLSDFEVMTALETEAVVFTTISCTGLRGPSLWHMRGMGRLLGARGSDEETQEMRRIKDLLRSLKSAMMTVVDFVGEGYASRARLGDWVNVGDVVRELGSWGDDELK